MDDIEERLTPAGSKVVQVIAADKILRFRSDFIAAEGGKFVKCRFQFSITCIQSGPLIPT